MKPNKTALQRRSDVGRGKSSIEGGGNHGVWGLVFTSWKLPLTAVLIGTVVRIHQLWFIMGESNDFRKTQTAFVAREFFRDGIDLFSYPLPVFGSAQGVHLEMPIFQAGAALLQHLGLSSDMSGMLLSLIMFQLSGVLMWLIVSRWISTPVASLGLVLYQLIPYNLEWATAFLIETTALAFSLAMVYSFQMWIDRKNHFFLVLAGSFSILAFLTKITTPPGWVAGAALYFFLVSWNRKKPLEVLSTLVPLGLVALVGLIAGFSWSRYADSVKEQHPITSLLTSHALSEWNFGSLAQRLDPYIYVVFGARTFMEIMGFTALLLPLLLLRKEKLIMRAAPLGLILTSAFGPAVFFNIYQHDYYFLALVPAMTTLSAWVIVECSKLVKGVVPAVGAFGLTIVLIATLWTSFWGAKDLYSTFVSPPINLEAIELAKSTSADAQIIVAGCDWNPTLLYYADRKGLMLPGWFGDFETLWQVEDISTYSYIYLCNEAALTELNYPGELDLQTLVRGKLYKIE